MKIEILKIKNYTFIPTSLFRDYSLFRGFFLIMEIYIQIIFYNNSVLRIFANKLVSN